MAYKMANTRQIRHMSGVFIATGGRGGIRTRDRVAPMPPFQGGAFNRSTTLPRAANYSAYWYKTQHPNVNFELWFF